MIQLSPPPFKTDAIPKFEAMVAKATGTKYALATSSGTAAIHLALLVHGIGPGDTVLCPDFTFAATVNPVLYCGAEPIFIGCDHTMAMAENVAIAAMDEQKPKAVIAASLYGDCPSYSLIRKECEKRKIAFIEDACEALGATNNGKKAGSFGDMAAISFNLNKIVTTGGGGALVSNDKTKIDRARFLATQAKEQCTYYLHKEIGYNYRIAVDAAATGVKQMRKLKSLVAERRRINGWYREFLPASAFPSTIGKSTYWLTLVICENAGEVQHALHHFNIESRRAWYPMSRQPVLSCYLHYGGWMAERFFSELICLPSTGITRAQVKHICGIVEKYL